MSNEELVRKVANYPFYLKFKSPRDQKVLDAMNKVDRRKFLPQTFKALAYIDRPSPIGEEQTCSQPSMVGFMADVLELEEGMKVLEIGTGCGYHAAVTSYLVGREGKVVSLEYLPELEKLARSNIKKQFKETFEERMRIVRGDGSIGFEEEAPFDRIYLTAGIGTGFKPEILARQLKPEGGILLFPEQEGALIKQIYEGGKKVKEERYDGIIFVPLKGENS